MNLFKNFCLSHEFLRLLHRFLDLLRNRMAQHCQLPSLPDQFLQFVVEVNNHHLVHIFKLHHRLVDVQADGGVGQSC
jgi:hypothetical protein